MIGKLRVWWIPQVGSGCPTFYVMVTTVEEGVMLLEVLGMYDEFQYENRIKPDYSNAGGLEIFEEGTGWCDWEIEDDELGYFDSPEEYVDAKRYKKEALDG